jgi:predicted MPP superfamily phosphohydrolase
MPEGFEELDDRLAAAEGVVAPHPAVGAGPGVTGELVLFEAFPQVVVGLVADLAGTDPDLVVVTGDLVSRPRGEPLLRKLLGRLGPSFVVLGNHDVEHSRDPFSRAAGLTDLAPARLLVDESDEVELRGRRVQIVGVDPRAYRQGHSRPWRLADDSADLRILLCHYPSVLDVIPSATFDLVLTGHMHDGQISLPLGRTRKYRFAHPRTRYATGVYARPSGIMHVSPGLGTTFVPFRFFARPEATELVLKRQV